MSTEKPVISFTESAAKHIQSLIEKNPKAIGFRLSLKKGGCTGFSYVPNIIEKQIKENDLQWKAPAGFLVYIDKESIEALNGTVLDFEDRGLGQTQLIFKNPNVKDLCGCGESFNV